MFNLIFTALDPRISRQGIADNSETESLSANALPGFDEIAQAGERCVEKVMMVEEITYDDQIVCHHSYTKKCHNTYITSFEAVQVFTYLHRRSKELQKFNIYKMHSNFNLEF